MWNSFPDSVMGVNRPNINIFRDKLDVLLANESI